MWVVLLLGQVPLSGSVVICTTEDGRARLERPDHHGHGESAHHNHECDHDHDTHSSDVCVETIGSGLCCQDVTLDFVSPSLVQAKRVGSPLLSDALSLNWGESLPQRCGYITSFSSPYLDTGPHILRSVILLV